MEKTEQILTPSETAEKTPELYRIKCDKCECEVKVPFAPVKGRPVLCAVCFAEKMREESSDRLIIDFKSNKKRTGGVRMNDHIYLIDKKDHGRIVGGRAPPLYNSRKCIDPIQTS